MIVRIHGFDWHIYSQQVMPTLGHWLLKKDEKSIYQMYQQTRCAQDEQSLPAPLQALCTWSRAQTYVKQLPHSPDARREYEYLCSAERFTAVSDRYVYRHPPQLLQPSEALRTIWGALIESYCLPWFSLFKKGDSAQEPAPLRLDQELLRLLNLAETNNLAEETSEQEQDYSEQDVNPHDDVDNIEPTGVVIGRLPTTLHIRGWLATISVRAMALFELLACERRCMPFGYQPGTPFASYAGYLTPHEVQQLSLCLDDVQPPNQATAVMDHQRFRQQTSNPDTLRMIDEVLPLHADTFLAAVHLAAHQKIGLICSIG